MEHIGRFLMGLFTVIVFVVFGLVGIILLVTVVPVAAILLGTYELGKEVLG
jgi:hypothetical protein